MISDKAHVDPAAKIGNNVTISPFAFIDADVEIGDNTVVMPYASIMAGTRIGKNCKVYQYAIVGADPQDFRWKGEKTFCYVGDNTVIRENVIINRGITPENGTRIGSDCFIMAKSHIGHDTVIGDKVVVGNGATLAGDVVVDTCSILSSNVILHERSHVGKWAVVKGGCRIGSNVPPFVIIAHNPAEFFGINAWIMKKHGFSDDEIDDIAKAYRHLYQSGTSVFNALKRIEADVNPGENRDAILNFIRENNLRVVGAHLDVVED
ncbi:MAG: acyl-ACP--UDP-N-acetylglucosamine O-acyltransferase [Muribaculaceae bacterium]|nr:acyl-ACP--UDP-N-acetylglucosamine O-acyltransferase [Bacteroidales bacterium]MBD5326423.1 acyl-ACP--UDP-N-acetylglucosamine O-acyltransferase [Bacteroides sp.]MDE6223117.1 acyl-ACP--UDP-N-acetylglucosamine O-acyltransferase [Muribaculaceae bacterium]MBD5327282.1 acyl-ACP--UDP-N-acetylglucosamine O-acyltransferase [Bacteroides sp.]MBD5415666.1 acyl-ACP--UDP-N-acetylglucosamine O-acyltransferase [Bacteroides sp.]